MRSAILGAFSLFLQFLGYFSLSAYMYGRSRLYGSILFVSIAFFIVLGTAHHVKYALTEYVFLKLGRDTKAHGLMLDLFNSAPITKSCYLAYLLFVITLIVAIVTGTAAFPIWAVIFYHIADIYPSVSISDHRYFTYRRDGFHAGLDDPDIRKSGGNPPDLFLPVYNYFVFSFHSADAVCRFTSLA